jgi:hypothetical protein
VDGRPKEYVDRRMRAMGYELVQGNGFRYWAPRVVDPQAVPLVQAPKPKEDP